MKPAGKWVRYVVGSLVGLLIIAVILFFLIGDMLIRMGVQKGASSALKVPVEVNNVHLSVFRSSVEIDGLTVGNPAGYELPYLLKMGQARAAVAVGSLMSDTIDIDYIMLDGMDLTVEQKGFGTNLQEIINSLPKSQAEAQQTPGKKLRIKTLEISNVSVTLKLLPIPGKANKVTIKLSPIKMENLGSDSPLSMAALTSKILVAVTTGITTQAVGILPDGLTSSMQSTLSKSGQAFMQGGKDAIDLGKGVGQGIMTIFNPNKKK